jgi:hypothetical protein
MRCLSCNQRLSDQESVRKYANSNSFIDLCNRCFSTVSDDIPDIEEGDFPSEWPEEDEGVERDEEDYQQFRPGALNDDC